MAGNSKSGRPQKSAEIRLITGTHRSDRHGDEADVEAGIETSVFPSPPPFLPLSDRALEIWAFLREHCGPWTQQSDWVAVWGVVRLIERLILNHEAQATEEEAGHPLAFKHTVIEKQGPMYEGGVQEQQIVEAKSNPLVDQEIKLFDKVRAYIAMLGLSPVDRARMPKLVNPGAKADPIAALTRRVRA